MSMTAQKKILVCEICKKETDCLMVRAGVAMCEFCLIRHEEETAKQILAQGY